MRAQRAVACMAVVIALAGACGGDDDGDSTSGSPEPTSGQSADDDPRTESERQADQDAAEAMLLTLDDFPSGWQEEPADDEEASEEEDEAIQADLAECLGIDPEDFDPDNPSATSPTFTSPDEKEVSVDVAFAPSAEAAAVAFETLSDDATPGCYGDALQSWLEGAAFEEGLPEGVEVGDVTASPLSFAALGDESSAFRVTLPVSAEGVTVDLYLDIVFARVGRIGIEGTFDSQFSPFAEADAAALMQTVIDRVPTEERG